jgi:ubiquinone/menaquinone biosynthesis C-methylase UbiE
MDVREADSPAAQPFYASLGDLHSGNSGMHGTTSGFSSTEPHTEPSARDSLRVAYDIACEAYARKFIGELDHKPFDRELLKQFAAAVGAGRPVLDIGCGPGHMTAHLTDLGVLATGIDLSPKMIERALRSFPQSRFVVGDFFALPSESSSIAGILAFYCIVHLTPAQLVGAFSEMFRVLSGGGLLLLSFHVGSKVVRAENFLDTSAVLDFTFFEPSQVEAALRTAGFDAIDVHIRAPYDIEYPSTRCYLFAHKPQSMS